MIEFLTDPVTITVGTSATLMIAANAWDNRNEKKHDAEYEKEWGLYDLELWHSLWAHPELSVTFYRWVDGAWKEQDLPNIVERTLRWFERDRGVRKQFATEIGAEGPDTWSADTMHRVAEYGIWNAVERLDALQENRACTCRECRRIDTPTQYLQD